MKGNLSGDPNIVYEYLREYYGDNGEHSEASLWQEAQELAAQNDLEMKIHALYGSEYYDTLRELAMNLIQDHYKGVFSTPIDKMNMNMAVVDAYHKGAVKVLNDLLSDIERISKNRDAMFKEDRDD